MISTSRHIIVFLITFMGAYVQYRADCNLERIRSEKHQAEEEILIRQEDHDKVSIGNDYEKKSGYTPHGVLPGRLPDVNTWSDSAQVKKVIVPLVHSNQRTFAQSAL